MKNLVQIKPELVSWAIEESQISQDILLESKKYLAGLLKTGEATYCQLEDFAKTCHVPFGFLFLNNPPSENSYSPSFRTIKNAHVGAMSQNLKQTITDMEFKRDWMSSYRRDNGCEKLTFFSTISLSDSPAHAADTFRTLFEIKKIGFQS